MRLALACLWRCRWCASREVDTMWRHGRCRLWLPALHAYDAAGAAVSRRCRFCLRSGDCFANLVCRPGHAQAAHLEARPRPETDCLVMQVLLASAAESPDALLSALSMVEPSEVEQVWPRCLDSACTGSSPAPHQDTASCASTPLLTCTAVQSGLQLPTRLTWLRQVVGAFNSTERTLPAPFDHCTIHGMMEHWADQTPNAPAVSFEARAPCKPGFRASCLPLAAAQDCVYC